MNTITIVFAVFTLWLVMGLGFLSAYAEIRRTGKSTREAWFSWEGILFLASLVVPVLILIYRAAFG